MIIVPRRSASQVARSAPWRLSFSSRAVLDPPASARAVLYSSRTCFSIALVVFSSRRSRASVSSRMRSTWRRISSRITPRRLAATWSGVPPAAAVSRRARSARWSTASAVRKAALTWRTLVSTVSAVWGAVVVAGGEVAIRPGGASSGSSAGPASRAATSRSAGVISRSRGPVQPQPETAAANMLTIRMVRTGAPRRQHDDPSSAHVPAAHGEAGRSSYGFYRPEAAFCKCLRRTVSSEGPSR